MIKYILCNAKLIKIQIKKNLNTLHKIKNHQVTLEWAHLLSFLEMKRQIDFTIFLTMHVNIEFMIWNNNNLCTMLCILQNYVLYISFYFMEVPFIIGSDQNQTHF